MNRISKLKIAIRIPNWIGDAVLSTSFLHFTKKYFPDCELYLIMRKKVADVFNNNPHFDNIIIIDDKRNGILSSIYEGLRLRKYRFDIFFILPDSFSSAMVAYFSGAAIRIGYKNEGRSFMLNLGIREPIKVIHRVYKYLNLLKAFLVKYYKYDEKRIDELFKKEAKTEIFLSKDEVMQAKEILRKIKGFKIGINPNVSAESRRWFKERFAQLADRIVKEFKAKVIFFGSKEEEEYVSNIVKSVKGKVYNFAGKINLREYITILSQLNLFITNDSGPMHLANAVGTEVIALEGAADINETGMFNNSKRIYINKNLPCSPCVKNVCPYNLECLREITVEDVFKEVRKRLRLWTIDHRP